jgi:NTP pyrophosphatase (non-canonical NTP hydrolase)
MKYSYEQLLNRSYKAIQERGLITEKTHNLDFYEKAKEELYEIEDSLHYLVGDTDEEITDLMTVCAMWLMNRGKNPIEEFKKVVEKNEQRARNKKDSK